MLLILPANMVALLAPVAPLFPRPVWRHVQVLEVLVVGAILTPGRRMLSSALRAVGLHHRSSSGPAPVQRPELPSGVESRRVVAPGGRAGWSRRVVAPGGRAGWSRRRASQILLGLLVAAFAPTGPLVLGIDATIERRRGKKIAAAGISRDPVRQGDMGTALVDKDELLRVARGDRCPPGGALLLVALAAPQFA